MQLLCQVLSPSKEDVLYQGEDVFHHRSPHSKYQDRAEGNIRYITISPEVEGLIDDIPAMKELGITVAIGHS